MRSVFSEEKKLSIAALSQTLPDRLIEQVTPFSASSSWKCWLVYWADTTGRRNMSIILLSEELIEHLDRCFPSERFARPRVHRVSDGSQFPG